jgi:predicted O-linked N-acetylglucosamine transferase (SPINDLY family)
MAVIRTTAESAVESAIGKAADAAYGCAREIGRTPDRADPYNNLGLALMAQGRPRDALAAYGRALVLAATFAEAHNNLGIVWKELGDAAASRSAYRRALALRPEFVEAHNNAAVLLLEGGRLGDAEAACRRSLAVAPNFAVAWYNLGNVLRDSGHTLDAAAAFAQAIAHRSLYPEAFCNLGSVLRDLGRFGDAVRAFRLAIALRPVYPEAQSNLGIALLDQGDTDDAMVAYRRAIILDPAFVKAYANLGNALKQAGHFAAAITACRRAVVLQPDFAEALAALVHLRQHTCDWSGAEDDERRLLDLVRQGNRRVAPLTLVSLASTPADQLLCAKSWVAGMAKPLLGADRRPSAVAWPTAGKLRLGYLSGDFHSHATAYLAAELFERHDRSRFEVVAFSYGPDDGSDMRRRLVAAFDAFVDLRGQDHGVAARTIRDHAIDVLVDLKGHTWGARTPILAWRPAPIQVNYLGYPGTMGADFIDYIVVDPFIVPPGHDQAFSEALVRLPDCYQPNDRRRAIAAATPSRAACGLPEHGLVFCCFNNTYKIGPAVFAVWMRLLAAAPDSVLWLLDANILVAGNLRQAAASSGIDPDRLVFAPRRPLADHLARYRLADLVLDAFPCNGHTTVSDALWAGVPVLTCVGETFASRVAGSLLTTVGLPELIAGSLADYQVRALELAGNANRRAILRSRLAANRLTTPLFDTDRLARHLEAAYLRMRQTWLRGDAPASFAVEG